MNFLIKLLSTFVTRLKFFLKPNFRLKYSMKKTALLFLYLAFTQVMMEAQNNLPIYTGTDLGLTYSPDFSFFRIYAPSAKNVTLRFYKNGHPNVNKADDIIETDEMQSSENGTWVYHAAGDRKGQYYTFQTTQQNATINAEVPDPYAKAVGVNGLRAAIIDLKDTKPDIALKANLSPLKNKTDAILYELHVRDASIAINSGIKIKGKFLGLTESNTKNPEGLSTGLDHIKELGVTHVHLLPIFDYYTVDETQCNDPNYKKYNWGYDPMNYNVPEGSYSTDPYNPVTRIKEFKTLIQAMHAKGLRVVMDVVYNHTMFGEESNFNQIEPHYYYRYLPDGSFSNGSGCKNETASEQPMMRKFMIESTAYWVKEYDVDGFRFDLMGLHDIETMNLISKNLHSIKPEIILYGEGWTGGDTPLQFEQRSVKAHTPQLDRIAAFSDDMRDGAKGSVFDGRDKGFASGKNGMEETIKFGVVAATQHPQVDYSKVNYSKEPWAVEPFQCINYVECHDNHTLWDRLLNSNPNDDEATRIKMHKLAQTIVLTAQGIPFLHAGTEFLRTKKGVENSYNSPDDINELDWHRKTQYKSVFEFFKQIIALRKNHPAFRMPTTAMIQEKLKFIDSYELLTPSRETLKGLKFKTKNSNPVSNIVMFTLGEHANGDTWKSILVIYNGNNREINLQLPVGKWQLKFNGQIVDEKNNKVISKNIIVPAISAMILAN